MNDYEVVIGLEIHAELCTDSKIFCGCKNKFGADVNTLCCPICTGMPGALPVLNKQVVDYAIKMGHALNCNINNITKLDRKNYFYPDLPKAYQISQYDVPLCQNGYLDIRVGDSRKKIGITRIHIEEDAGKLIHDSNVEGSLADYNRCGVPLIEIVTEPDIRSAEEAKNFMESIASILLYLGISDAKMQEGSMRADVNVSIRKMGDTTYGTRTEMKNVNSYSAVYRAIEFESKRQMEILAQNGTIDQETRRWDDGLNKNIIMRTKEDAQDYRYFPDPDLLTVVVSAERVQQLRLSLPELPMERAKKYVSIFGLSEYDASVLAGTKSRGDFFDETVSLKLCEPKAVANWILGDIAKELNTREVEIDETKLTSKKLAEMIELIEEGRISNTAGRKILDVMLYTDDRPEDIMKQLGLEQISDTNSLVTLVNHVLDKNPSAMADYKKGKKNVLGFLVGQCMKESKGQGNPALLKELLEKQIDES